MECVGWNVAKRHAKPERAQKLCPKSKIYETGGLPNLADSAKYAACEITGFANPERNAVF
jgi:hypothetical protein